MRKNVCDGSTAYGLVKWWKIFTPEQSSGINRFVIKETILKPQFFCRVARLAAIGLKKKALRQIPVAVYGSVIRYHLAEMQPWVPCQVHRHMAGVTLVVPYLPAFIAGPPNI
uniref:Uncharacterized protein n=1 Tax=Nelumbo nucifera TaxID=4432 RepID=A0A822YUM5_NELNU|nr:TPA_asm: hypothetical protein HUJ06_007023 [Nelumbo nucifera]